MSSYHLPKRSILTPFTLSVIGFISLLIFGVWIVAVASPVLLVELNYQYKRVLRDTFGATSLRGLILPQFRFVLHETGKNTTNGISIPAIFLDEPVVYNVDPNDRPSYLKALRLGIAHASGTNFPGTGGLGYYFAHSSSPEFVSQYNAVFYLLGKLKPGDTVTLWHDGVRADYKVTHSEIVAPSDLTFLKVQHETETIVLQTCWPPGTTKQRLLVYARFVPKEE